MDSVSCHGRFLSRLDGYDGRQQVPASTKGHQCIVRPDIEAVSIHRRRGRDGRIEIGLMRDRELIAAFRGKRPHEHHLDVFYPRHATASRVRCIAHPKKLVFFTGVPHVNRAAARDQPAVGARLAALPPCYREEVAGRGSDQNVSVVRSFTRNPFGSRTGGAYVLLSATR